jgi:hypothetical protein
MIVSTNKTREISEKADIELDDIMLTTIFWREIAIVDAIVRR